MFSIHVLANLARIMACVLWSAVSISATVLHYMQVSSASCIFHAAVLHVKMMGPVLSNLMETSHVFVPVVFMVLPVSFSRPVLAYLARIMVSVLWKAAVDIGAAVLHHMRVTSVSSIFHAVVLHVKMMGPV